MDRMTLQYMLDRTKSAAAIVNKIDQLSKQAEELVSANDIRFRGNKCDVEMRDYASSGNRDSARVVATIKTFAVEAINEEIKLLEDELAAL
jgi:hypothetical protein